MSGPTPETYNLAPWPNETGYDATPTLRCGWCNGVGNMKPLPREYEEGSLEPGFLPPAVICPRCKGSGLDPDCTKEEIGKGVRLSKSPATKWYVTEYPEECDFAVTDGNEIIATIIGGDTIGNQCDLASRIAELLHNKDVERDKLFDEAYQIRIERDELKSALRRILNADIPRPLGGIIDDDERKAAIEWNAFERGEARQHAKAILQQNKEEAK